mgnify:CR=1 FL=1
MSKVIRLYRCCTERERDNGFKLTSKMSKDLGSQVIEEIISHELDSTTEREVFYSFSTRFSSVEYWRLNKIQNGKIMYLDIDLDNMPVSVLSLHPIYIRGYLMSLIAVNEQILNDGYVTNPATGREHTVLGVLNYSQRSIAGWAYSMRECVLQCKDQKLSDLSEIDNDITAEQTEELLLEKYMRTLKIQSVDSLRNLLQKQYTQANVTRRSLLNLANGTGWYKAA